ncbi:MAG: gamma-glutamyltransferase [Pirellulaceae bacterium]|nr:gamma-glutamyltransferase [Pirellulaceae bacterium]
MFQRSKKQIWQAAGLVVWASVVFCCASAFSQQSVPVAEGKRGMIATVHPLASEVGVKVMRDGGNAIDAVVAAALMLGVVDGTNSGIGGGCFILIRTPNGEVYALDARETAPRAAHRDMFLRDGKPDTELSQIGPLASGTPGALAGYAAAVERFGRKELRDLILPAAEVAEQGFPITPSYARGLRQQQQHFAKFPGSRAVFLNEAGEAKGVGELMVQTDLAATYRSIAAVGVDWFYRGPFAERTAQWMRENGGVLAEDDFENYEVIWRTPVRTTYRSYEVLGFPPPSSGGVHVAQILNILENFDLQKIHAEDPASFTHIVVEAMRLAFADRAYWLGDPAFADVPRGLLDKEYAKELAGRIRLNERSDVAGQGTPPRAASDFFPRHTTHLTAVDAEGYWVALTSTVNTAYGSKVIVPGLGVVMNNQMDDFSIAPGTPNAFGLVGNEANAVEPGKRPLSSMSPTIILQNGVPIMTNGAAGGPRIITSTLLGIVRRLDLHLPLEDAVGGSRFHHQWRPDKLYVEPGLDPKVVERLRELGHDIEVSRGMGVSQAIWWDAETQTFRGVADPRAPQPKALGW